MSDEQRRRKNLWNKNKNCYWCNEPTKLLENPSGSLPPDTATLDHIRNRLGNRNTDHPSITVLACYRCNNLRGKYEQLFYFELDPTKKPTQPHPDGELLIKLDSRVTNALLGFLEFGGSLNSQGSKPASKLRRKIKNWLKQIKIIRSKTKVE